MYDSILAEVIEFAICMVAGSILSNLVMCPNFFAILNRIYLYWKLFFRRTYNTRSRSSYCRNAHNFIVIMCTRTYMCLNNERLYNNKRIDVLNGTRLCVVFVDRFSDIYNIVSLAYLRILSACTRIPEQFTDDIAMMMAGRVLLL